MSTSKRGVAFAEFGRGNLLSADPLLICIIGGKRLPAEERGPLDTDDGIEHPLYDERLDEPLTEEFINNIDAHGVDTPVLVANLDDVATLVAGRKRVRAARVVNLRRKKRGEPAIKVDCKLKRAIGAGLLGAMITENEGRTDDGILTKIEKLKRLMNRGVSIEDAAIEFCVGLPTVKGWLAFEDGAIAEAKAAARTGRLSASAAAEIAKIADPEKQLEKLQQLISVGGGKKVSARAARAASRVARGKNAGVGDKKTQKKLLAIVQSTPYPNANDKRWWNGVEEAIKLIVGADDVDPRLQEKLDEAVKMKAEKKKAGKTSKKTIAV